MTTDPTSSQETPLFNQDALLEGAVRRITFQNEDRSFTVLRVEVEKTGVLATVIGPLTSELGSGTNIVAHGRWETHPKFGKQFKARFITEQRPTTKEAIEKYLSSGSIKGLGPVLAKRIIDQFGEKTLEILDASPESLSEVPGIGKKKLLEIQTSWLEKRGAREVILFFQEHGISLALAQRIYRTYRERSIDVVKENPYILTREVWGIGFHTADKIARLLGIAEDSPLRLEAALLYTLKRASEDGHCFLPKGVLGAKTVSLLQLHSENESSMEEVLSKLIQSGEIVSRGESIYLSFLERAERLLAEEITERIAASPQAPISEELISACAHRTYDVPGTSTTPPRIIKLSSEQKQALQFAATHTITVITGGPGCGKTTVLQAVTNLFRSAGLSVKLAAPTGRAAQRLSEVCDVEASTIHRLLKFDPATRHFLFTKDDPLALDVLILDESSMIELTLAANLFEAIPKGARIVIVGDADQLPSVGPGRFLADLLTIPHLAVVRLQHLFRRGDESSITHIAHQVNSGVVPEIPSPDGTTKCDAYFLGISSAEEGALLVERLVCEQIPKKFGFGAKEITVLSPMNKGELGIISLNLRLQARLTPTDSTDSVLVQGNIAFRLGDRVCQRVNNYNITDGGVFNGDQGEIIGIDGVSQTLSVQLWDGRIIEYPRELLYQLDLAYALTIHRSQGSEVPVVVLVLHDSHSIILERQLLYTAITRAKRLLIIVGQRRALALAVKKTLGSRRYTALSERCLRPDGR